jgi:thiol peroxidase
MADITLGGTPVTTGGTVPAPGDAAPDFTLTGSDLGTLTKDDFAGQNLVLNIFPSVDTPTCASSVRTFNERAADLDNTTVLCVSADLPFAQGRFCGSEGLENVKTASTFKNPEFLETYGVSMLDGRLAGLCARAVVVLDSSGTVLHSELVDEIASEPDYDAALAALS